MLSRPQQILLKQAQQQAGIPDAEYRETLALLTKWPDCTSSKDKRLGDDQWDMFLKYFEAIYWRGVDQGTIENPFVLSKGDADKLARLPFRARDFWKNRNTATSTSRDRYTEATLQAEINQLENDLAQFGYGLPYFQAIQNNMRPFSLINYKAALKRTLAAKQKKSNQPF